MELTYYKAINFDLDTKELGKHYKRYQQAYYDLMAFFKKNGFHHRQGSGYVSERKLTSADIIDLIGRLRESFAWTSTCIKRIDVTNIGAQYDLTVLFSSSDELDEFEI